MLVKRLLLSAFGAALLFGTLGSAEAQDHHHHHHRHCYWHHHHRVCRYY